MQTRLKFDLKSRKFKQQQLTKWRGVRPAAGLGTADDGLADQDEALVAVVLHGVADHVLALVEHPAVLGRDRLHALYGWKEDDILISAQKLSSFRPSDLWRDTRARSLN